MDETIARAINSINQGLEYLEDRCGVSEIKSKLIDTSNLINRLRESNSPSNDWTRLFCRQLKRLMDYNESLSVNFWIGLYNEMLYVVEGPQNEQGMVSDWKHFLKRMHLEDELERRELQFQQTFGKRKSLNELFCEHKEFFEEYLHKCISFHSEVEVSGLADNLDNLLWRDYGVTKDLFSQENRRRIKEKLECIKIPLDCSYRSLEDIHNELFNEDSSYRTVNNSLSNFLPSIEQQFNHRDNSKTFEKTLTFEETLTSERWIVILGDPGSAKTSLLRWITGVFAEQACLGGESVTFKRDNYGPVRIPVLIRIGEFAAWLEYHKSKTVIDYIGKHTWLSQLYTHNGNENVLKEVIYHGHALILLDGLDEVPDAGRRGEIVDHVRKFIDEYVRAPDFYSAYDDTMFDYMPGNYYDKINEIQSPSECRGNQIVVTSRIIGYQMYPLISPFIRHYTLSLMDQKEAKKFVNHWMTQVEEIIHEILLNERINIDEETVKNLTQKRFKAMETMFEIGSELMLSNPSLLSLICTVIFQSFDEFYPKTRVELYHHAVQSALNSWTNHEPSISKDLFTDFLINLATYLHLESPSGLIDSFDINQLCCSTLKKQGFTNNRIKLHEHANKLISILESNIGIVSERGLQVFGFQHLSFQEYFVSQSLVKSSSIEQVTKLILSFAINPRFRESVLLAFEWISWKWSFYDYDKFCNLLFTPTKDYVLPLGVFLFWDALNNIQKLPSKSVIFIALNSIFEHPLEMIGKKYFISNLFKLPEDIIIESMHLHLKDEKQLSKFCEWLLTYCKPFDSESLTASRSKIRVICQQLWTFRKISMSADFIIDQTLRRIDLLEDIFNNEFSSYLLAHMNEINVHPLIFSVIISLCGGVKFKKGHVAIEMLSFSPKQMHRESSIIPSIMKYFLNNKEPHSIKVQILINEYESILQNTSRSDTSVIIVDTFIALICLQGLSQPLTYQRYQGYQALFLALNRLKWTWFYLKRSYKEENLFPNMYKTELDVKTLFSQFTQSSEKFLEFSLVCTAALDKLGIKYSSNLFSCNIFLSENFRQYFDDMKNLNQMFQHEIYFLLNFVPQSLQKLYSYTTINPIYKNDSLPLVVLLSQCLMFLENFKQKNQNFYLSLSVLQSQFKEHMLENYVSVLFWEDNSQHPYEKELHQELFETMKQDTLFDQLFIDYSSDWEMLIDMERQRIFEVKNAEQNKEKDLRLFAASMSLARLFQIRYHSHPEQLMKHISLSIDESKEVHAALINIRDPILRIIVLSTIMEMKDPLIFDEELRENLQVEMINLLQSLLPDLPLLTSTLLFIRCYPIRQVLEVPFKEMANVIGKKLNELSIDNSNEYQETSFIALRQLNDIDLSPYLSDFANRKITLSKVLQFNSNIFFEYFTNTTSFDSSNIIFLSSMYLVELAFDAQTLQMYTNDIQKKKIPLLKEWEQLWNNSSKNEKIMTYNIAIWITNYIELSEEKKEIDQIIGDVSSCLMIERKALSVIEKWLNYRANTYLRFFSHYAALQLVIEGANISGLVDIINEMFDIDKEFCLKHIVKRLFSSRVVDLTALRQILVSLHRTIYDFSEVHAWIDRKEILEVILNLEMEQVISDCAGPLRFPTKPFLLMMDSCSDDLQLYLIDHLQTFINKEDEIQNACKEQYIAVVIKWIIESSITNDNQQNLSEEMCEYIITLLHDRRFPQVQKVIINGFSPKLIDNKVNIKLMFMQDDVITHFEKIIYSYDTYSDDILESCLLGYSNCLINLQNFFSNHEISSEIQVILTNLIETSLSEIITTRAAFCLILAHESRLTFDTISEWFRNKCSLTPKKEYNLLLQLILYNRSNELSYHEATDIVNHIKKHSDELIDTFVLEVYNYLKNKYYANYLSDPLPDYIEIVKRFADRNVDIFLRAIRKSSFGEEKFKRELCQYRYYGKGVRYYSTIAELYGMFGVLTIELIELLKWIYDVQHDYVHIDLKKIKQVSDRSVLDRLFNLLCLTPFATKHYPYSHLLGILSDLIKIHAVSLFEVHQQISVTINSVLDDYKKTNLSYGERMFNHLVSNSSIKQDSSSYNKAVLFNEIDINEEFERQIERIESNLSVCLRRNYLLTSFQAMPDGINS